MSEQEPPRIDGLPQVAAVEDLLATMRATEADRRVIHDEDANGIPFRAVAEYDRDENSMEPPKLIAIIPRRTPAYRLIDEVLEADTGSKGLAAWKALPLRYHSFFDACLLPRHRYAPREPSDEQPLRSSFKSQFGLDGPKPR